MNEQDLLLLIDAHLAGELDLSGQAQLEKLLAEDPFVAHLLAEQQKFDQALGALLGNPEQDEKIKRSVFSDLRATPVEDFKTDFMELMRAEEEKKKREEEAQAVPPPPPAPVAPLRVELPRPAVRRRWPWIAAGGLAAGLAIAAIILFVASPGPGPELTSAYLLAATPDVRVVRGGASVPVKIDMALQPGDRLEAGAGGEARIGFTIDPTRVTLKGPVALRFAHGGKAKRVELEKGEIEAFVSQPEGAPMAFVTPAAEAQVDDGQVRLSASEGLARLEVRKGQAQFRRGQGGSSVRVPADHYAVAGGGAELIVKALEPEKPEGAPEKAVVATVIKVQGDVYVFTQAPADRQRVQPGQRLTLDQGLVTEGAASLAVVDYPDATRLEVGADTVVRKLAEGQAKHVALDRGIVTADVVKQPADHPMDLATPHASVRVLGTRFVLQSEKETRLQVEEGVVRFTSQKEKKSIEVRSGYYAVAGEGIPLEAQKIPGGARYLEIDLTSGAGDAEGIWFTEGRSVRQTHVKTPGTNRFFKASTDRGVLVDALVRVDEVGREGPWGFGLAVSFGDKRLVLRSHQGADYGSVFEFQGVKSLPFEHGREGAYRVKLQVERRQGQPALLRGKIWQGDREPDGWMIEDEMAIDGPLTEAGFQAVRAACTFSKFRVEVLKDQ